MKKDKLMDCEECMMAIPSINHDITNLVRYNSNCNIVTADCNVNYEFNSSNIEICAQYMVGREGFEPSNPAMSRRYLNQARPPALALKRHKNFVPLTVNAISF
jgi:hypothetical protein